MKKNNIAIFIICVCIYFIWDASCFSKGNSKDVFYLSLADITKLALKNNLDIQIAKFDAYIKRNDLLEANSIFDTFFNANINYTKNKKDIANTILGTKSLTNEYSVGISKKIPSGTTIELEAYDKRIWDNSPFSSVNPNTEANLKFSITQPLAKNFFGLIDRGNIKITKLDIENSDITSLDTIENSLALVQQAYWELVLRYQELKIKEDMLKEAEKLYNIYKRKIRIGLVEEPDLLAADANVSLRENSVLEARMLLNEAKNNLLYLLNLTDLKKQIIPIDKLNTQVETLDLYKELKQATQNRRDYKIVKKQIKSEDINLSLKKNALWPEIDLEASFTKNGIDPNYKNAWEEITSQDHNEIYVGLKVSMPLERREEKAQYNKSKLNKAKYLLLLKRIERIIFRDINNNVTQVNTLANQVETNKKIVRLQERKLKAEEVKLQYGRSSSDIIIRFQEDLLNARLNLARALFSYRIALINLERNKNTLLSKYWKGKL
jgi:outer membrane protein TolC